MAHKIIGGVLADIEAARYFAAVDPTGKHWILVRAVPTLESNVIAGDIVNGAWHIMFNRATGFIAEPTCRKHGLSMKDYRIVWIAPKDYTFGDDIEAIAAIEDICETILSKRKAA